MLETFILKRSDLAEGQELWTTFLLWLSVGVVLMPAVYQRLRHQERYLNAASVLQMYSTYIQKEGKSLRVSVCNKKELVFLLCVQSFTPGHQPFHMRIRNQKLCLHHGKKMTSD